MKVSIVNKITALLELVIKVNAVSKHDVFFNFSGHVNKLEIYYFVDGFVISKSIKTLCDIGFNRINEEKALELLEKVEKDLIALI